MSIGNGIKRHIEIQDEVRKTHVDLHKTARWSFLGEHPAIIDQYGKDVFKVSDRIMEHFKVPFTAVKFCGSSQTGFSFIKKTDFDPQKSDLDVAIIDTSIFLKIKEEIYTITKGYSDLSCFPITLYSCRHPYNAFVHNLKMGFINPYCLPNCDLKNDIDTFSNTLTTNFRKTFKSITFVFYETEYFFICKQEAALRRAQEVV